MSNLKTSRYYRSWFFESLSYYYDFAVKLFLHGNYSGYVSEIYKEIPIDAENVADFGCGTGELLSYIAKNNENLHLIGLDLSKLMLQKAKKKLPPKTEFYQENVEQTHFNDHSFDCVIMSWILHELPTNNLQNALKEAVRVLKTEGKLIIFDFHKSKLTLRLFFQHLFWEKYIYNFYDFDLLSHLKLLNLRNIHQKLLWNNHLQIVTAVKGD